MKNRLIRRGIIVVALLATLPGMPVVAAYERGDYATAIRGLRKAADQGNAASQVNLGHAYAEGRGAPQDYQEALKWYRKAADQGDALGQFNLGHMYNLGYGVSQDYAQAHKWLNLAASLTSSHPKSGVFKPVFY